jgi:magnesium-transporting ATPase (P-type)
VGTDAGSGLSNEEVARRLEERGPNELEDRGGRSPWAGTLFAWRLLRQLLLPDVRVDQDRP